jgi:hypothetical protein
MAQNGNPVGDLSGASKCGAKNRQAQPCRRGDAQRPMPITPRALHGAEDCRLRIERIRQARTIHGFYSAAAIALRSAARIHARALRAWLQSMA